MISTVYLLAGHFNKEPGIWVCNDLNFSIWLIQLTCLRLSFPFSGLCCNRPADIGHVRARRGVILSGSKHDLSIKVFTLNTSTVKEQVAIRCHCMGIWYRAFDPLKGQHIVKINTSVPKPLEESWGVCQSKFWPVADLQAGDRNCYCLGTFLL